MDLVEFLTVRYDEDEQLARHAAHIAREAGTSWVVGPARYVEDYEFVSIHTSPPNVIEVAGSGFDDTGGIHGLVYAHHIARHDPARVLADLAAKRSIVRRYRDAAEGLAKARARNPDPTAVPAAVIGELDLLSTNVGALHLVAKLLAMPYRDHPDFNEAWRIDG